jgi:gamma-glutamylputrescine oxidase
MSNGLPYLEISPWVEQPRDLQPALEHDLRCDVVVIGGGLTGLCTALELRAQGADIALLEQDFAGSGASGRNAGHLTPSIGKDVPTLLKLYGEERATRLLRFADAAVEHAEEIIRKYEIECEYEACGNFMAGLHPKHEASLRRSAEAAGRLGARVRFVPEAEMRRRGMPSAFLSGLLEERGGHLHPGKFVLGLRRAALAAGVRLFEGCPLTELIDGAPIRARTAGGEVRADHAVLATNAYTPRTGWKKRAVAPLRVTLFETQPIAKERLDEIGWSGREGVYTAHEILESYRLTARNTIVGGSKVVRYAWQSGLASGYDPAAFRIVEEAFRQRFPTLRELPVSRFWGGWIALTPNFLPTVGSLGSHQSIHHGVGFCGHGVAQATLVGAMLAARIQGRAHAWDDALPERQLSWPPEPVRWLASKLLNGALTALDARTDRQIRSL